MRAALSPAAPLALLAATLGLAACGQPGPAPDEQANAVEPNAAATETLLPPPLPVALPLDRAQLLAAVRAAADAAAAGDPPPEDNAELVGRSFQISLPFGCDGPSAGPVQGWAGWTFDAERHVVRLVATAPIDADLPWLRELADERSFDAVEGFWIERPWTNSDRCPPRIAPASAPGAADAGAEKGTGAGGGTKAAAKAPEAAARSSSTGTGAARPTVGIAEFFAPDAPRTRQRGGRPYTHTLRAEEAARDRTGGYRLMLTGRITGFADRQPIRCRLEAAELPPVCLVSATFTRVAFEDPATGTLLATWER